MTINVASKTDAGDRDGAGAIERERGRNTRCPVFFFEGSIVVPKELDQKPAIFVVCHQVPSQIGTPRYQHGTKEPEEKNH